MESVKQGAACRSFASDLWRPKKSPAASHGQKNLRAKRALGEIQIKTSAKGSQRLGVSATSTEPDAFRDVIVTVRQVCGARVGPLQLLGVFFVWFCAIFIAFYCYDEASSKLSAAMRRLTCSEDFTKQEVPSQVASEVFFRGL